MQQTQVCGEPTRYDPISLDAPNQTGAEHESTKLSNAIGFPKPPRSRLGFFQDFRRFFQRGLAALLPTLITLWLLIKVWDFLWENLGSYMVWLLKQFLWNFGHGYPPAGQIELPLERQTYFQRDSIRRRIGDSGGLSVGCIGRKFHRANALSSCRNGGHAHSTGSPRFTRRSSR